MRDTILCCKCYECIDISGHTDDYYETGEEETLAVIICPKCFAYNSIYWESDITFSSRETEEKEIKEFYHTWD